MWAAFVGVISGRQAAGDDLETSAN